MNKFSIKILILVAFIISSMSCGRDFLELPVEGTALEVNFYKTEEDFFSALVATYDVLQWNSTNGWTMILGLTNTASDDCYAGGSDASDQPSWIAWDNFSLDPFLGPQEGLWNKYYAGIYRANVLLEKLQEAPAEVGSEFKARVTAEAKFLRAYFYFDLVRLFGTGPLLLETLPELSSVKQVGSAELYAQIEQDLRDAINEIELPETVPPNELGRITKGAAQALLGKAILYQNDDSRMMEAAGYFEEVINSGNYGLESNYGDLWKNTQEFGIESVFEIQHSSNRPGDWGCCFASGPGQNPTEGNFNVQFFGMRDYVGPEYAAGWGFCPVTEDLVDFMQGDPRFDHTILDANALVANGASFTEGYQNTGYFIKKYAPIQSEIATDGVTALGWSENIREIRFADVLLMAAEAIVRAGGDNAKAREYANQVRQRVNLQPFSGAVNGQTLLNAIYVERRKELATEGHRFFDLVRTGQAEAVLGPLGFQAGKNEVLPIHQLEIDISDGILTQNPGY